MVHLKPKRPKKSKKNPRKTALYRGGHRIKESRGNTAVIRRARQVRSLVVRVRGVHRRQGPGIGGRTNFLGPRTLGKSGRKWPNWPNLAESGRNWPKLANLAESGRIWPGRGGPDLARGGPESVPGGSKLAPRKVVHLRGKLPKISQNSGLQGADPGFGQNLTTIGTRA